MKQKIKNINRPQGHKKLKVMNKKSFIFIAMAFLLFGNAEIYAQKGNFKKAEKYQNSAWARLQKYGENDTEALSLYTQAMDEYKKCILVNDKNTGKSYHSIGRIFLSGSKSLRDNEEALKYLLAAIEIYEKKGEKDHLKALCYFDTGLAQYRLGDFSSAFSNFEKATKLNSAYAVNVAGMYWVGVGVEQDLAQALKWNQTACLGGQDWWANIYALEYQIKEYEKGNFNDESINLYLDYIHSKSMGEDKDVWMSKLKQSADLGNPPAQVDYWAHTRNNNNEVSKGMTYLQKAVEANYVPAFAHIGDAYNWGFGINIDYQTAAKYYQTAAEQGHPIAQNNLGILYHQNRISAPNGLTGYGAAYFWYNEAAEQGLGMAKQNRALVANAPKTKAEAIAQTINTIVGVMNTSMEVYNNLNKSKIQAYTPPTNKTQQTATSNNNSSSSTNCSSVQSLYDDNANRVKQYIESYANSHIDDIKYNSSFSITSEMNYQAQAKLIKTCQEVMKDCHKMARERGCTLNTTARTRDLETTTVVDWINKNIK